MRNLTLTEALVRDRQHRFEEAARHHREARERGAGVRSPLRAGAGWMLVRAGLRLAQVDPGYPAPTTLARG